MKTNGGENEADIITKAHGNLEQMSGKWFGRHACHHFPAA